MAKKDLSQIREKVLKLKELFDQEKIKREHNHEVNPALPQNDRINYIYFTLPVALNFQRNSPAMWKSALATYTDPETNYLFYPEKVVETDFAKLQQDLTKHKLALQKNKHVQIWQKISETLNRDYDNDPRNIIKKAQNCVVRVKNLLQITEKPNFPYLSGAKMANYWLYILNQYTDVKLRNLHKISIIPDTHVLQASIKLGLSDENTDREQVAAFWESLLKDTPLIPIDMHPVLWNWSRAGFEPSLD